MTWIWLRRGALMAVFLALAGTVVGCAPSSLRVWIEVDVARGANGDWPIPVALVAARDPKLLDKLLGMTAKQWFAEREQIRRDYPGGSAFREWEWEYVPGQVVPAQLVEIEGEAIGAVLFANYRSPGEHRVRLPPRSSVGVVLGKDEPAIVPARTPPRPRGGATSDPALIVAWAGAPAGDPSGPGRAPLEAGVPR